MGTEVGGQGPRDEDRAVLGRMMRSQGCGCPRACGLGGHSARQCVTSGPLPGLSLGMARPVGRQHALLPIPTSPRAGLWRPVRARAAKM